MQVEGVSSKEWISYALCAAFFCTISNTTMSEVSNLGFEGLLYLSPGAWICGIVYFLVLMTKEYRKSGRFTTDLNLRNKETQALDWLNVRGFLGFAIVYFLY